MRPRTKPPGTAPIFRVFEENGAVPFSEAVLKLLLACVLIGSFSWLGCGAGSTPLAGKITLDGQPLSGAAVSFKASDTEPGRLDGVFLGLTDDQGNYTLRPASGNNSPLSAGKYLVFITTTYVEGGVPDYKDPPPERVPGRYRQGIEYEVSADGRAANFELTSK